ncbi:MAG: TlpA family protein disulfide reductase [Porphyromonadaceae bacterium]|nr:TlpA family protein disulfide reductase [Porphyromonadaceae bacterium]
MKNFKFLFLALLLVSLGSCAKKGGLQEGTWRGELALATDRTAPFLFEVKKQGTDSATFTLINGEERVELPGATFHGDTLIVPIVAYDAVLKGFVKGDRIEGKFIKNYVENDPGVTFTAVYGVTERFAPAVQPTTRKIDGKWDVLFVDESGDTTRNVGIFKTNGDIVTGSILTNSGDLRFLEGAYTGEGVQLSAFGGLSPYYIDLNFTADTLFEGTFYTTRGTTKLLGTKNDAAALADAYSLAGLKSGYETLSFSLPDLEGNTVSLSDERYKGKVVVVSILGSWCPNCLDEMAFLAPWYEENKGRGVEIIGIAFERKNDEDYAKKTIGQLKERYKTGYPILFGGAVGKENVAGALPELDNFSSYPTTLFIDKQGKVRTIHTGFNGPATGLFYEEFIKEFNALVDSLLEE